MKTALGPKGLILLRHMADTGPITPRQGGLVLHPEAKGGGSVRGSGRGNTDTRGTVNRAAGCLLGHMARAGWVVAGEGERYAVPYSITDAGREVIRARLGELEADPVCGLHDPVPKGRKRCRMCGRARKLSAFSRDRVNPDGRGKRCRFCASEQQAERRAGLLVVRDAEAAWQRASKETIILRCLALIRAAREARRVGTWRGRPGIRAYADLGLALDAFDGNGRKDPSASEREACDPADNEPPDRCDPTDSDWSSTQHGTQEWLRDRSIQ